MHPGMTPVEKVGAAVLMLIKYLLIMDVFSCFPLNRQRSRLLSLLSLTDNPFFT